MGTRYDLFINLAQVKKLHIDQQYLNQPDQESYINLSDKHFAYRVNIGNQKGKSANMLQET